MMQNFCPPKKNDAKAGGATPGGLRPPGVQPPNPSFLLGRNEKGQLGHGDTKRVEAPKLIEVLGNEAIVLAACGRNHTLALTGKGEVPASCKMP